MNNDNKTLEEMAKEYVKQEQLEYEEGSGAYYGFLAGYKAAKDQVLARFKSLLSSFAETSFNPNHTAWQIFDTLNENQAAQDQVADVGKVMPQWISVKDRLPEIPENDYSNRVLLLRADRFIVIAKIEKCVRFVRPLQKAFVVETDNGDPIEEFTHWMELPAPPKGEK